MKLSLQDFETIDGCLNTCLKMTKEFQPDVSEKLTDRITETHKKIKHIKREVWRNLLGIGGENESEQNVIS